MNYEGENTINKEEEGKEKKVEKEQKAKMIEYLIGSIVPLTEALYKIDVDIILNEKNIEDDFKEKLKELDKKGSDYHKEIYREIKSLKTFNEYIKWLEQAGQESELLKELEGSEAVKQWDELVNEFNKERTKIIAQKDRDSLERYFKNLKKYLVKKYISILE